jgi:hypothetical protein
MSHLDPRELYRIKHVSHKCYGWALDDEEALDIWNICHVGSRRRPTSSRVPFHIMVRIARGHLEIWGAYNAIS